MDATVWYRWWEEGTVCNGAKFWPLLCAEPVKEQNPLGAQNTLELVSTATFIFWITAHLFAPFRDKSQPSILTAPAAQNGALKHYEALVS